MLRSFDGLALRQLRTRPLRALLTGLGVVLGVGMVFAVLLLVGTIRHTFNDLVDSAFGKQELAIYPKAGTIPESKLTVVRSVPGVKTASGAVQAVFTRLDARGRPISGPAGRLLTAGYDSFATPPYRFRLAAGRKAIFGPEITLERNWARDRHLAIGDYVRVGTPAGPARLHVVGLFKFSGGQGFAGQGLGAMPVREARMLMAVPRGFHVITAVVARAADVNATQKRVERAIGAGVDVRTAKGLSDDISRQLGALNVLLYFFSGIALFVGAFLILNSFNMSVLQRMREIGMLRTLGATRRMIARTVVTEALVIAASGTVLGLGLGFGLAAGLMAAMRAIGIPVGALQVGLGAACVAAIVGIAVTTAGALWPARRAARVPPIMAAHGAAGVGATPTWRRGVVGVLLAIPGIVFGGNLWFGGGNSNAGVAAMLGMGLTVAMFVGIALTAPFVIGPIVRVLGRPLRAVAPAAGRLAGDSLRSNAARTAATAVALTIGLSVVVVNSSMSSSFIGTIKQQLDSNFARDFNVQARGFTLEQGGGPGVPASVERQIRALPQTAVATSVRALLLKLPKGTQTGLVLGVDPAVYGRVDTTPVQGTNRATALAGLAKGEIVIGASYAHTAGLERGSTLALAGPGGTRKVRVAGVLQGIGEFAGQEIQMSQRTMQSLYGQALVAQVAVKARSAADRPALERRVATLLRQRYPNLELQSAAAKKREVSNEISRNFNLFNAIVLVAVIVSILGVVNTLAMSVLERTREIGVLRALGSSRWQVRETMLDESLLITVAGALSGTGIGLAIGWFWVQGLGSVLPGISFHLPWGTIVAVAVVAIIAGVVAAILPARRAARLPVIEALTYE
jgi:putative ABC transport system permease protein